MNDVEHKNLAEERESMTAQQEAVVDAPAGAAADLDDLDDIDFDLDEVENKIAPLALAMEDTRYDRLG